MKKTILTECIRISISKNNNAPYPAKRHYTFIIQNNKIIEYGRNRIDRSYKELGFPETSNRHSEVDAWKRARGILKKNKKFEIVNIRLNRCGEIRDSKPCSCCYSYLLDLGCRRFYYSCSSGEFKYLT